MMFPHYTDFSLNQLSAQNVHSLPGEAIFLTRETGEIIFVNDEGLRLLDYDDQEKLQSMNLIELIHSKDQEIVSQFFDDYDDTTVKNHSCEVLIARKDKSFVLVQLGFHKIFQYEQPSIMVSAVETLWAKLLDGERNRIANIVNTVKMPIIQADSNGRIQFFNKTAQYLHPDISINGEIRDVIPELNKVFHCDGIDISSIEIEVNINNRYYNYFIYKSDYEDAFYLIGGDITELRNSERKLVETISQYKSILEDTNAQIFLVDSNFAISYANHSMGSALGIDPPSMRGKHLKEVFSPEEVEILIRKIQIFFEEGDSCKHEDEFITNPGNEGCFNTLLLPIIDKEGNTDFVLAISRSIANPEIIRDHSARNSTLSRKNGEAIRIESQKKSAQKLGKVLVICSSIMLSKYLKETFTKIDLNFEFVSPADCFNPGFFENNDTAFIVYVCPLLDEYECQDICDLLETTKGIPLLAVSLKGSKKFELEIIRNGARGIISSESEFNNILPALLAISSGELWCQRSIMLEVLDQCRANFTNGKYLSKAENNLTDREYEVLLLIAQNKTNREIAEELKVSYSTVVTHVYNIYKKLNIHNRFEAIQYAIKHGYIEIG